MTKTYYSDRVNGSFNSEQSCASPLGKLRVGAMKSHRETTEVDGEVRLGSQTSLSSTHGLFTDL